METTLEERFEKAWYRSWLLGNKLAHQADRLIIWKSVIIDSERR